MSIAVHFVLHPLTHVFFRVVPHVSPMALNFVHLKLPLIDRPVSEREFSESILLSHLVQAVVDCSIGPSFKASPVLLVIKPFSDVFRAICMPVCSVSISLVVFPISIIHVSICVMQFALAACSSLLACLLVCLLACLLAYLLAFSLACLPA